jgi:hypothetical protein
MLLYLFTHWQHFKYNEWILFKLKKIDRIYRIMRIFFISSFRKKLEIILTILLILSN